MRKEYNKLAILNILRFVFAIVIVLWHIRFGFEEIHEGYNNAAYYIRQFIHCSSNTAFLLISGMTFYLAYYKRLERGELSSKDFIIRRLKKIYPLVIITTLVGYVRNLFIYFGYHAWANISITALLSDLLLFGERAYITNGYGAINTPVWFLFILFYCYILVIITLYLTRKNKSVYWLLIPLALYFIKAQKPDSIIPFNIGNEVFAFFTGIFFMIFLEKFEHFKKSIRVILRVCGISLAIFIISNYYCNNCSSSFGDIYLWNPVLIWCPFITSVYGLKINRIFDMKFFKYLGSLSFPIFLWHCVIPFWNTFEPCDYKKMTLFFVILFVLSVITLSLQKAIKSKSEKKQITQN